MYINCVEHWISARNCYFYICQEGIGLDAINDAFLLEGAIYRLLRRHCRGQRYYVHLLELFTEVTHPNASLLCYSNVLHVHTFKLIIIQINRRLLCRFYHMISCTLFNRYWYVWAVLNLFFFLDLFPDRAGTNPRSDDGTSTQNWPWSLHHGEVRRWGCL